jgi:hypothetical protein
MPRRPRGASNCSTPRTASPATARRCIHWRDQRRATDLNSLRELVGLWQGRALLFWNEDDIAEVALLERARLPIRAEPGAGLARPLDGTARVWRAARQGERDDELAALWQSDVSRRIAP